jgi:hypothetical protein
MVPSLLSPCSTGTGVFEVTTLLGSTWELSLLSDYNLQGPCQFPLNFQSVALIHQEHINEAHLEWAHAAYLLNPRSAGLHFMVFSHERQAGPVTWCFSSDTPDSRTGKQSLL